VRKRKTSDGKDWVRLANGPDIKVSKHTDVRTLNLAAENAQPHTKYEWNDYDWTTDDQGRTHIAEGIVDPKSHGRMNSNLQTKIGNEGEVTDVGFHLIRDSANSPINRL
jgi:hypothetical protein